MTTNKGMVVFRDVMSLEEIWTEDVLSWRLVDQVSGQRAQTAEKMKYCEASHRNTKLAGLWLNSRWRWEARFGGGILSPIDTPGE